jgi:hypothetical protein
MLDLAQAVKDLPPPRKSFTARNLLRITLWGASAAGALFIAVMASRSDGGTARIALAMHGGTAAQPMASHGAETDTETQRLGAAVRDLSVDDAQIKSRLAAIEHDVDDITGSISRQVDAAKDASIDGGPTVVATAAATSAMIAATTPLAAPSSAQPAAYGIDIGGGPSLQSLRVRWNTLSAAHPELFAGLEPVASIKDIPNRIELRLVAGPLPQPEMAVQLCASLAVSRIACQPTFFQGQRLAQP